MSIQSPSHGRCRVTDQEEYLLDSDEEEAPAPKRENSTIKKMRETLDQREARLKEVEERNAKYEAAFLTQAGLTEKQAAALRAAGYDADPDGINSFRSEVLGVSDTPAETPAPTDSGDEIEAEEDEDGLPAAESFRPTPTGAGGGVVPEKQYSSNELVELSRTDPTKARKLMQRRQEASKDANDPSFWR